MTRIAQRTPIAPLLRRLGREVLEAPDMDALAHQLTRTLAQALDLREAVLLLWDRKLDRFEALSSAWTGRRPVAGPEGVAPATRFLLVDGVVQETPGGGGDGVLVPLMARSGLVGMLVLGAGREPGDRPPLRAGEARLVSDLAARVALAVENHVYQKELIASERMAALGTMAGMLAHDFRGPMTVIRGYAELIAVQPGLPADVTTRANGIVAMVDRLDQMTRETLDFARGGRLARRALTVPQLVAELVGTLGEELPTVVVSTLCDTPHDTVVSTDVDKLRRVVGNIAQNARDAMGGRGRIHIEARLGADAAGTRLELVMSDDGPGVAPEVRERLFDPFVTHGKKGGTGLGLAVARRFVEDHGGVLDLLERAPGAHFRIALPLGADAPAAGGA